MVFGQDRLGVGADLVGRIAGPTQYAVTPHDHQVDLPALHQVPRGIVRDDLVRNALLGEFPSRERRPLAPGPGLVTKDVKIPAGGLGGI